MSQNSLQLLRLRGQIQEKLIRALDVASEHGSLALFLRALEMTGQPTDETRILIERERASRESAGRVSESFTEGALLALDHLTRPHANDDAAAAAAAIFQVRHLLDLPAAVNKAFEASDLIPLGRDWSFSVAETEGLSADLSNMLINDQYRPTQAYFIRAPKARFSSRPAASLHPADRFVYQSLADRLTVALDGKLPQRVLWPRRVADSGSERDEESRRAGKAFAQFASETNSGYLIRADVESFFDYIDHSLLGFILTEYLGLPSNFGKAVELFLKHVMGSSRGIPQGPIASDMFATAYLLPLDMAMKASEWETRRYQDDFWIRVGSIGDARNGLRELEIALRDLGLRVSPEKTYYKRATGNRALGYSLLRRRVPAYDQGNVRDRAQRAKNDRAGSSAEVTDILGEFFEKKSGHAKAFAQLRSSLLALGNDPPRKVPKAFSGIVDTFPLLAPEVSVCLSAILEHDPNGVLAFIKDRISTRSSQEWENSWLVLAPQISGVQISEKFQEYYQSELAHMSTAPLTQALMMRVLASKSEPLELNEDWLNKLPHPLRAELQIAVDRRSYPGGPASHLPGHELPDSNFGSMYLGIESGK